MAKPYIIKKHLGDFAMTRFCVGCGERIRRDALKFADLFNTWRCPCCRRAVKGVEKMRGVK